MLEMLQGVFSVRRSMCEIKTLFGINRGNVLGM